MNLKNWQLYALYALMQATHGGSTDIVFSEADSFMFYDPTEECNNSTEICLTSFKYCTKSDNLYPSFLDTRCHKGAKEDDLSWYSGNKDDICYWMQDSGSPLAMYDYDGIYTLKWQNNNPKYPTTVMWRSKNFDLSMYKVMDAGDTEWTFSIDSLAVNMVPTEYVPANGSQSDRDLIRKMAEMVKAGSTFYFTIAQPEDPEYKTKNGSRGFSWFTKNATNESSPFVFPGGMPSDRLNDQRSARRHEKSLKEDIEKKWRLGVGIGVGLGVPLISAIVAGFAYKADVKRGSPQGRIVPLDKWFKGLYLRYLNDL